jgi:hypothetical protein
MTPKNEKMNAKNVAEQVMKMECFNCGEKGYIAKNGSHNQGEDTCGNPEPPIAGMMLECAVQLLLRGYFDHQVCSMCSTSERG